jgi:hypothetical protein
MKKFTVPTAMVGTLAATALGLAGAAAAAPTGSSSAAEVVSGLQAQGYSVQINGIADVPLSECTVTGVHGLSNTDAAGNRIDPTEFTTVYVDISCPSDG